MSPIDGAACSSGWTDRRGPSGVMTFVVQKVRVEIHSSARRHGIADDDILHAFEHSMAIDDLGDGPDRWLVIAPSRRLPEAPRAMTKRIYGRAESGKPMDDDLIEALADEAEAGYDVDAIISRRAKRGRRSDHFMVMLGALLIILTASLQMIRRPWPCWRSGCSGRGRRAGSCRWGRCGAWPR